MPAGQPQAQNHPATWDSVKPRTQMSGFRNRGPSPNQAWLHGGETWTSGNNTEQ